MKSFKIKTRIIKSPMEEEIPSGTQLLSKIYEKTNKHQNNRPLYS